MQQQSIKASVTVRELGDIAQGDFKAFLSLIENFGPWPMPPAGYTPAPNSDDRWVGSETIKGGWILTPTWYASTNTHYVEMWAAEHYPPNYTRLTAAEALELASDLAATARAAQA